MKATGRGEVGRIVEDRRQNLSDRPEHLQRKSISKTIPPHPPGLLLTHRMTFRWLLVSGLRAVRASAHCAPTAILGSCWSLTLECPTPLSGEIPPRSRPGMGDTPVDGLPHHVSVAVCVLGSQDFAHYPVLTMCPMSLTLGCAIS